MYKLVIVEDEEITRRALVNEINWGSIECIVVGEGDNGISGLEVIQKTLPDIVVTDIEMAGMSGIALGEHIIDMARDIKIIFITGYDKFVYAQAALKLGVKEFILKPTNCDELLSTVKKITLEIKEERKRKEDMLRLQKIIDKNKPILVEKFFSELLSGSFNQLAAVNIVEERKQFLGIELNNYYVYSVEIDDYNSFINKNEESERQIKKLIIKEKCGEIINDFGSGCCFEKDENLFVIYFETLEDKAVCDIIKIAAMIQHFILEYLEIHLSIGVSIIVQGYKMFKIAFEQSYEALHHKFYVGDGSIIYFADINFNKRKGIIFTHYDFSSILNYIRVGDIDNARLGFIKYFNLLQEAKTEEYNAIKNSAMEIFIMIQKLMYEYNVDTGSIFQDIDFLSQISKCNTLNEIKKLIELLINKVSKYIQENNNFHNKAVVKKIIKYIVENYNKNITLNEIAEYVYMNPQYVCRLIKKETGTNFSDILAEIRIDKAIEFLKDVKYKTYEVAGMVGINNSRYFSQMFKKIKGMTPTEYREKL